MKMIARTTLLYALLGPLLGGVFMVLLVFVSPLAADEPPIADLKTSLVTLPILLLLSIPFAIALGGVQAACVGLATGLTEVYCGIRSIWVPLWVAGAMWAMFLGVSVLPETGDWRQTFFSSNGAIWLAAHLASAAGAWLLQAYWSKRRHS
jgi:hypothetical protein